MSAKTYRNRSGETYKIEYYSLIFHLRRSLFVITTFTLYKYPGLQVMSFMQSNILYLIYVGHIPFFTEKRTQNLEIFNEFIGIIMCYSYLMFVNIVSDQEQRRNIGYLLLGAASLLIVVNASLLFWLLTNKIIEKIKQKRKATKIKKN